MNIIEVMKEYACRHQIPIASPDLIKLLKITTCLVKPSRVLEIGTAIGYSAIIMAQLIPADGRIDTIEKDSASVAAAMDNIKAAGLAGKINIIEGDALEVLKCLEKEYDMIFLDASKGQYPEFLPECLRLLRRGGLLISDNVLFRGMTQGCGGVVPRKSRTIVYRLREYLDRLSDDPSLETVVIPMGDGIALSLKI